MAVALHLIAGKAVAGIRVGMLTFSAGILIAGIGVAVEPILITAIIMGVGLYITGAIVTVAMLIQAAGRLNNGTRKGIVTLIAVPGALYIYVVFSATIVGAKVGREETLPTSGQQS